MLVQNSETLLIDYNFKSTSAFSYSSYNNKADYRQRIYNLNNSVGTNNDFTPLFNKYFNYTKKPTKYIFIYTNVIDGSTVVDEFELRDIPVIAYEEKSQIVGFERCDIVKMLLFSTAGRNMLMSLEVTDAKAKITFDPTLSHNHRWEFDDQVENVVNFKYSNKDDLSKFRSILDAFKHSMNIVNNCMDSIHESFKNDYEKCTIFFCGYVYQSILYSSVKANKPEGELTSPFQIYHYLRRLNTLEEIPSVLLKYASYLNTIGHAYGLRINEKMSWARDVGPIVTKDGPVGLKFDYSY